ncbi:AAA family ATPase [bacterium]|nr:AAA family ATPase [bacterium]
MNRIVVFGNSGSGKSTFARNLSENRGYAHLDLDTVAWEEGVLPPKRRLFDLSRVEIDAFIQAHENWVVEGCYSDLLEHAMSHASEIVFLNPGVEVCIQNAKNRPWEAHKYQSPEAQNANLAMLISWIEQYDHRQDEFSLVAHRRLFDSYLGDKREYDSNSWTN